MRNGAAKAWLRALESIKIMQTRPSLTLPLLVQEVAQSQGGKPALLGEHETLSYHDLAGRVQHYANWAACQKLARGERVGLLMPNCPEYPAIWLGITQSGGVVALLNGNLRGPGLQHCIRAASCSHVIIASSLLDLLSEVKESLPASIEYWVHGEGVPNPFARIDIADAWPEAAEEGLERQNPSLQDLALLIFTSGTTGMPKAAKVTHGRIMEWSTWFAGMMDAQSSDRLYNCLPMYHSVGGVVAIGAMLVRGGSVVIRERFSAKSFWDDIVRSECTIFQYIGELCRYLLLTSPQPQEVLHHLRLCCGNGLRADVWEAFKGRFKISRILEFYAATEGNVSLYNCEGTPGAIGRVPAYLSHRFPVALVKCDIATGEVLRDAQGRCVPCAVDEPGEAIGKIQATMESQFDGYEDAQASESKIIGNVFSTGDRWFRTGDLMRKDQAGYYYFLDRLGDSFRWKGENVSTTEVAGILNAAPGISEAVVFGVTVPGNEGKAGMAAITTDAEFSFDKLRAFIKQHLPAYARPLFVRFCDSLEATGTFKLQKHTLQSQGYQDVPAGTSVWVYDSAADLFSPCDASRLEWIAAGGIGRKTPLSLAA